MIKLFEKYDKGIYRIIKIFVVETKPANTQNCLVNINFKKAIRNKFK